MFHADRLFLKKQFTNDFIDYLFQYWRQALPVLVTQTY